MTNMKVGDIVSNWPYGEPIPYIGIVIEIDKEMAHILWIPEGDSYWMKTYALKIVDDSKKVEYILDKTFKRDNSIKNLGGKK